MRRKLDEAVTGDGEREEKDDAQSHILSKTGRVSRILSFMVFFPLHTFHMPSLAQSIRLVCARCQEQSDKSCQCLSPIQVISACLLRVPAVTGSHTCAQ
jgi:hypothetical protein